MNWLRSFFALSFLCACGLSMTGCKSKSETSAPSETKEHSAAPAEPLVHKAEVIDWCREHGVPESVCTRCNSSLVAKYKEKGDWCNEHGVPESQCFICHPELKQQFAKQYKAKYGKEPPTTAPEAVTQ